ncbi:MAG TPA: glycosyltransferase [Bryobacteraceae bacterium]|nr:glycosyltransferase [Bryobacteraceae bacterium]
MRVLLTNNALDVRAGTELYLRDVAVELIRRGHQPTAYSTKLGAMAEELRRADVPVVSGLDALDSPPDIIHGHHHYETQTAILRFPEVPAIYYCHGWLPWQEAPLRSPRIFRYVAVDELCRERLIVQGGIAPEKIELLLNFFDARLFPARRRLPSSPRLALAFGHTFSETSELPVLRKACGRCGIELHVAGLHSGATELNPGRRLADYDIVFAKARAAIEAVAVGAAVVLCGYEKLGPMVTASNFDSLRRLNFGFRTLSRPLEADLVVASLRQYDAGDAGEVSKLVRQNCELRPAVDRLINLYSEVIEEARTGPVVSDRDAALAAARYLEEWASEYKRGPGNKLGDSPELTACERRELIAIRNSVSWRWSQRVLRNPVVKTMFGRLIRSVASRAHRRSSARTASKEAASS